MLNRKNVRQLQKDAYSKSRALLSRRYNRLFHHCTVAMFPKNKIYMTHLSQFSNY